MARLPCLLCEDTFLNADTVMAHYRRKHHFAGATTETIYGTTCPTCGKPYLRLDQHSSRTHHLQLSLLFAEARRAGDRHGVVAWQIHQLIRRSLDELEASLRP